MRAANADWKLIRAVTAATGIDAMVHAIEAFTSRRLKNPVSDMLAREALRLRSEGPHLIHKLRTEIIPKAEAKLHEMGLAHKDSPPGFDPTTIPGYGEDDYDESGDEDASFAEDEQL